MTVHDFIQSRQHEWSELDEFTRQAARLALARVPLDVFQRGSRAYRQTIADLAYARMRFPEHVVVADLESLVGEAHSVIHRARRTRRHGWRHFWLQTWPARVRQEAPTILLTTGLFWAAAILGFLLVAEHPQLENFFVSSAMRESMTKGQLWTQGITRMAPQAASSIATNNITVTFACWALGITLGLGTLWLLVVNGLMLGAIFAACLRLGYGGALAEFVVGHGSLELPAIWIAAAAGLLMGRAVALPGRYPRLVELRLAARRSVELMLGTLPMLAVAALVEGFVSPSPLPGPFKATLGATLATGWLAYIMGTGTKT